MKKLLTLPKIIIVQKVCLLCCVFILLQLPFFILSCKSSDEVNEVDNQKPIITTNINDPLILMVKDMKGYRVEYYGERNSTGKPTAITDIIAMNKQDTITYSFNQTGKITKVINTSGTQAIFEWIDEKQALLNVYFKDGETQINTLVDFSKPDGGRYSIQQSSNSSKVSNRNHQAIKLLTRNANHLSLNSNTSSSNCRVSVTNCDAPDPYAQVYVNVTENTYPDYSFVGRFPTKNMGNGIYEASIPTENLPVTNNKEICEGVLDALDNLCTANEAINLPVACIKLSAVVASTPILNLFTPEVAVLCESFAFGTESYCGTLGASPTPGTPSLIESLKLCDAKFLERKFKDITITPLVIGLPDNIYGKSFSLNGSQLSNTVVNLSVSIGANTKIRSLKLSPSAPQALQDYTATVDIYCLKENSTITMTVTGTDGYSDSIKKVISSTQTNQTFDLWVPGALVSGIKDIIEVEIVLPNGEIIKKTASLVFN